MIGIRLGIVAATFAVAVFSAWAESPSYESRGYGGPLNVGPDFKSGKPSAESPRKKPVQRATRKRAPVAKAPVAKQPEPEAAAAADAVSENSSIAGALPDAGTPATDGDAPKAVQQTGEASGDAAQANRKLGCVKYLPTAGITASVPCE
jgi:hypothetical protein